MTKNLLKILTINCLFFLVLFEISSRIILNSKKKDNFLINSKLLQEYLSYVNHFRDNDFPDKYHKNVLKNSIQDFSIKSYDQNLLIYHDVNKCQNQKDKKKNEKQLFNKDCPLIITQGDSWAVGIGLSLQDELYEPFDFKKWDIINAGNSSFSIANYSGQLAYLNSKKLNPKVIILLIDQTDLGDDFIRYKNHIKKFEFPIPHLKVKPFGFESHRSFYNYYPYYPFKEIPSVFSLKPHSHVMAKTMFKIFTNKLKYKTNKKIDLTSTPTWSDKSSVLLKKNKLAITYVSDILNTYFETAESIGVEELHIFSHPHYRHIIKENLDEKPYQYSISKLINDVLVDKKKDLESNLRIYHSTYNISGDDCKEITCDGHFILNDKSSHLTNKGYKKFGDFIKYSVKKNSLLKLK